MIKIKQKHLSNIFDYLFAFALVFDCRAIYIYIHALNGNFGNLIYLLLIVGVGGKIIQTKKLCLDRQMNRLVLGYIIFLLVLILLSVVHGFDTNSIIIAIKFSMVFLYYILDKKEGGIPEILFKYRDVICCIAIASLMFWLFGSILSFIKPSGVVYSDWSGTNIAKKCINYYYVYFETQRSDAGGFLSSLLVRNSAIFTEAPMASFHFTLALIIECFLTSKPRKKTVYLLAITIISTIATTGLVILLVLLAKYWLTKKSKNSSVQLLKYPVIILGSIACIFIINELIVTKLDSSSGSVRIDDYKVCFKVWLQHPLFGCGVGNNDYIKSFMDSWRRTNQGLSNSLGQILAQGGILLFFFYILCIIRGLIRSIKKKQKNQFWFFLLFVLIFSITVVSYNLIVVVVLLWMVENIKTEVNFFDQLKRSLIEKETE